MTFSENQKDKILTIIQNELSISDNEHINLETSLDYYIGNPRGDEVEGRSKVVSTDVADAVEWIMPQIMKAFTQNKEVVTFDPSDPSDKVQAELESEIVYDVIMKENDGFVKIYQFVKDALLQNNGVLKVYYEKTTETSTKSFTGLTHDQLNVLMTTPNIVSATGEQDPITGLSDLKLKVETQYGRVIIECVPIEQFRYNTDHNSINLDDARFTAHVFKKTVSDLLLEGIPEKVIDELDESSNYPLTDFRFRAQGESSINLSVSEDESLREVDIAECFMKIDIDDDGIAEYCKVTVAGYDVPTHILSVEEIDYSPWVATTGILMSHKFRGLSIYDRLKQIQDAKTSLWRNMLDNLYLQNNQRNVVVESQVNLGDLLVSRPGGIIRAKRIDAIMPLTNPPIGVEAFTMMTYLDGVRAGRVGVAPEGEATPQRIGERVGSQGVDRLLTAKEELVGLIVRTIAETGIKPLCIKVRDLLRKHSDAIRNYEFRGQWVQVNPIEWIPRNSTTVRVGTGTGDRTQQIQAIQQLVTIQGQMAQMPGQALVRPDKVFNALNDFCKWSGLVTAANYFVDPSSQDGQAFDQQQKMQMKQQQDQQVQMQLQITQAQVGLAQAELQKAQAEQDNVLLKAQIEQLKGQLKMASDQVANASKDADRMLKKYEIDTKASLELTKIEVQAKQQQEANTLANRQFLAGENDAEFQRTKAAAEHLSNEDRASRQEDRADRQEDRADKESIQQGDKD